MLFEFQMTYHIYEIYEIATGTVLYVGCTKSVAQREKDHKGSGILNGERALRVVCHAYNLEDAKRFEFACLASWQSKDQAILNQTRPIRQKPLGKMTGSIHEFMSRNGSKGGRTVTPARLAAMAKAREVLAAKRKLQKEPSLGIEAATVQ